MKQLNEILAEPIIRANTVTGDKALIEIINLAKLRVNAHLCDDLTVANCKHLKQLLQQCAALLTNFPKDYNAKNEVLSQVNANIASIDGWLGENDNVTDAEWIARNTISNDAPVRPKTWDGTLEGAMLMNFDTFSKMTRNEFNRSGYFRILNKKGFTPDDILANYDHYIAGCPWSETSVVKG